MRSVTILLLLLLVAPFVKSEDDESKCCCTTYGTSVCLSKVRSKLGTELNATYSSTLEEIKDSAADTANLKNAERKWIAYRDATCKAEYGLWGGGSGGPNALAMCIIRVTRTRISDLKNAYLGCKPHGKQVSSLVLNDSIPR